jgi:nitrate reductase (NAD(P)H)
VFKNTQPKEPNWNVMGMMNNCWYIVKPSIVQGTDSDTPSILFRHPVEPGTADGGWMKPSVENQIASAKQEAGAPQKQFTRQEIEKHDKEDDCWIVVDGKVYDATSVLEWHPGGKAAVLGHAGKVHAETSNEFESIHDGYAYQKLKGKYQSFVRISFASLKHSIYRMHPWYCHRQSSSFHQEAS